MHLSRINLGGSTIQTFGLFVILYLEIGLSVCLTLPSLSFIITYPCMKYSLYLIHIVQIMYLVNSFTHTVIRENIYNDTRILSG
jgi:hypothetical protein